MSTSFHYVPHFADGCFPVEANQAFLVHFLSHTPANHYYGEIINYTIFCGTSINLPTFISSC